MDSNAECDQLKIAHETKTNQRQCPQNQMQKNVLRHTSQQLVCPY